MSEIRELPRPLRIPSIKRVGIYCRISKSRRGTTGSLDSQVAVLLDYIDNTWNLSLYDFYIDVGSGRNAESRKSLKRLLKDCADGKVDMIITKSASRFGRNAAEMLSICRRLKDNNIDVYFMNDNVHSIDKNGELSLTLIAAVAEGESRNKSENIKWGIRKTAQEGDAAIYSRVAYGYRHNEDGVLEIDEKEAEVVRWIFRMYKSGQGSTSIKKTLEAEKIKAPRGGSEWPKATIDKMLRNEKYCGESMLYKTFIGDYPEGRRIQNRGEHEKYVSNSHHEGIISKEEFEEVQAMIEKRRRKK